MYIALHDLYILECGFGPNLTPKASSLGEGCLPLIYYSLALSLANVRLGFFPIVQYTHGQLDLPKSGVRTCQGECGQSELLEAKENSLG